MTCGHCSKSFPQECTCPDREERINSLSEKDMIAFKWCVRCDKHYAFCSCGEFAEWMIKCGGKISSPDDWQSVTGQRVELLNEDASP